MAMQYYSDEEPQPRFPTNNIGLSVAQIEGGQEGGLNKALEKRVREGVNIVELQLGQGRNMKEHPDAYGNERRRSLKEIAGLNQVDVTTVHAPFDFAGYSGWDQRGWRFTNENQNEVRKVLESTINFSADIAPNKKGTNIVLHMNEFYRPMTDVAYLEGFSLTPDEDTNSPIMYMDKSTNTIETAGMNNLLTRDSEILVKEEDRIVKRNWDYFNKELESLGREKFFETYLKNLNEELSNEYIARKDIDVPGLAMIHAHYEFQLDQMDKKIMNSEAELAELELIHERRQEDYKGNEKLLELESSRYLHGKQNHEFQKNYTEQEKEKLKDKFNNIVPVKDIALDRASDLISELGLYAKVQTEEYNFDRPIRITPENEAGPQVYGSHPQEMIEIIQASRKKMQEKLMEQGYNTTDASNLAYDHIAATFDMQHFGMFKGHWNGSEEDFNKEYLKQVKALKDADVVGHLHIVDGHKGQHVHLPPGQGSLPLKEAVKEFYCLDNSKTSEGWGEGPEAHLHQTKNFDAEIRRELDLDYSFNTMWDLFPNQPIDGEATQTLHGKAAQEFEYLDPSPFFNDKGPWC